MIYERDVKITESLEIIKDSLKSAPSNLDLFFPYDKAQDIRENIGLKVSGSRFGVFWGSYIYFISKKGAKKILKHKTFNLPFDELLLELSVYYTD